ncbi:hypothetical protein ED28_11190 [[Pantoea] beijingensis]|uniref:Uncharacterized protein n=1 Tax=[Pantoea] beijingensis TaxID=1324864 RepID=A0A443IDA7_9GAMM|nr:MULTISPECIES: hypothetical protein [Erwiniaceae]RWR02188.1 hypothetical protein ED28_11190 [[Pantoea] beijingensis]
MSAKARFLKKIQALQPASCSFERKSQADIAAFRLRMSELQECIAQWLTDTGIETETSTVSLTDLLVDNQAFDLPALRLYYDKKAIKFTPLYLYGQGVTGCVEVSLCVERKQTPLYRLFMRAGSHNDWCCRPAETPAGPVTVFDEEMFFSMIESVLP